MANPGLFSGKPRTGPIVSLAASQPCFNVGVKPRRWWVPAAGLVVVLAGRLCYLVIRFQDPAGTVRRPHLESAALLLAVVGLIVRFATDGKDANGTAAARPAAV